MHLNNFISDCRFTTPRMEITVYSPTGAIENTFVTPRGFRYDLWMSTMYPWACCSFKFDKNDVLHVSVTEGNIVRRIIGVYLEN